ncbi:hypothetical protein [Gracilibacillus sp. YIM 98692]|uniref:hypothetical protein n=1 Tax=Gracilibacillus sp. YIM 98692 TaxID=2663532 RepID=UPI0013D4E7B5|nr:hypothetical protein [Gracilibacillus sp. YIM 98692]
MQINFIEIKPFRLTPYIITLFTFLAFVIIIIWIAFPYVQGMQHKDKLQQSIQEEREAMENIKELQEAVEQVNEFNRMVRLIESSHFDSVMLLERMNEILLPDHVIGNYHFSVDGKLNLYLYTESMSAVSRLYNQFLGEEYVQEVYIDNITKNEADSYQVTLRLDIDVQAGIEGS